MTETVPVPSDSVPWISRRFGLGVGGGPSFFSPRSSQPLPGFSHFISTLSSFAKPLSEGESRVDRAGRGEGASGDRDGARAERQRAVDLEALRLRGLGDGFWPLQTGPATTASAPELAEPSAPPVKAVVAAGSNVALRLPSTLA